MQKRPYLLINKIQNYAWGTKDNNAFIPQLLNFKPVENTPYAELWIGTHPKACSEIFIDDKAISLAEVLKNNSEELLGAFTTNKFGNQFPYLLKVLSASEALSIQSHPNKSYAEVLHAKDPVNYPDDNHKPEIAIALDSLTALAGFKELDKLILSLKNNPEIINFLGITDLAEESSVSKMSREEKVLILKTLFESLLNNAVQQPKKLEQTIEALLTRISAKTEKLTETEALFLELAAKNSHDDIGLLVVFFLELIHLNKGEAFFTGAGIPHAYIKGNIVECMANSDNVVRAGLTNKFKDIKTLSEIAFYNTEPIEIIKDNTKVDVLDYYSPVDEFKIAKIEIKNEKTLELETHNSFDVLLITNGNIDITIIDGNDGLDYKYNKGNTVLIPASVNKYKMTTETDAEVFRVTII